MLCGVAYFRDDAEVSYGALARPYFTRQFRFYILAYSVIGNLVSLINATTSHAQGDQRYGISQKWLPDVESACHALWLNIVPRCLSGM